MDRYKIGEYFYEGTNASAAYALKLETNRKYVVKKLTKQFYSWEETVNTREVQVLLKLRHENIVRLKEVVREGQQAFMVFEALDGTLKHLIKTMDKDFSESTIATIMWQIMLGVSYIHEKGMMHRNLTTDNILCKVPNIIKISGFTSAKEIKPRQHQPGTPDVTEKIVCSPEMLLGTKDYTTSIDIWASGVIMANLYLRKPLFNGVTDIDYLLKICSVLGTPDERYWPEGFKLAVAKTYKFPKMPRRPLTRTIRNASNHAVLLMHDMIRWVPARRPAAHTCLTYPFFDEKSLSVAKEKVEEGEEEERDRSELSSSSAESFQRRLRQEEIVDKPPKITYYTSASKPYVDSDISNYPPPRRLYRVASEPSQVRVNHDNYFGHLPVAGPTQNHHLPRYEYHPDYYWDESRMNHEWSMSPLKVQDVGTIPRRALNSDLSRSIPNDIGRSNVKAIAVPTVPIIPVTTNSTSTQGGNNSGRSGSATRPGTPTIQGHGRTNWAAKYLK